MQITKRAFLGGLILCGLLLPASAGDESNYGVVLQLDDKKVCESEVRRRIEDAVNKMISAAEARKGSPLSQTEKDEWLASSWKAARDVVTKHYTFFD